MLSKKEDARHQIEFVSIDQLVPQDHLLRKIEKVRFYNKCWGVGEKRIKREHLF
ncbi:hypothetical protein SAMN04324257_02192 [Thermoanaerobacter thermohydrosulfuricus]|nr:hypothetical protein SAMN04324257_02192 [Thermoanaerobacter thermohydrosulfuricus]